DLYERFNRLAMSGDVSVQDRDNREATYRDTLAKRESLKRTISAAERALQVSESQVREAKVKHAQSRKSLANSAAVVGQAEAAQIQPDVAGSTAQALRNRVAQAEARLRLARLNLSNTLVRAPQ